MFPDRGVKETIFIYTLTYGGIFLAFKIFKYRNAPTDKILVCCAIGWVLGLTAGFYLGYQVSIFAGVGSIKSSSVAVGICFGFGTANSQIGSFLGNVLLP